MSCRRQKNRREKCFGVRTVLFFLILCFMVGALPSVTFAADEEETDEEEYLEYVKDVQKQIRTRSVLQYGMFPVYGTDVKDGTYQAEGASDSTYFRISAVSLKVKNGEMTAEITIPSMSYRYVYMGTAAEAAKANKEDWIGFKEVNKQTVFTIPVEALNKEIECAAFSKARQKWYNRKIAVYAGSLPEDALNVSLPDYDLIEDAISAYGRQGTIEKNEETIPEITLSEEEEDPDNVSKEGMLKGIPQPVDIDLPDGEYSIEVNMVGGSGRASISSPTLLIVENGKAYAKLLWSSTYYDYVLIGDQRFENQTTDGGNSTFIIPIAVMDDALPIIADTTAMGEPVEIRYDLTFYSSTVGEKGAIPQEAAKKVLIIAAIILIVGAVLNFVLKKARKK